jgi:cytochrome c oxidase assembly protein subunit 15
MRDAPPDAAAARLRTLFAHAAVAAAALTFVVIVASAFMRHAQVGLACADWPACYGIFEATPADAPSLGVRIVRIAHRIAATCVLGLVAGLALVAWTQRPAWKKEGTLAALALALTTELAGLGVATPGARLPAVTLGNLLGGYLLLATLAATAAAARSDGARSLPSGAVLRGLALAVLAFVLVQAALGGSIGAQYALPACATLGKCPGFPFDEFRMTAALDPFRPLAIVGGRVVPPLDAAGVFVIHRTLAIVATVVSLALAWRLRVASRRVAATLGALALAAPLAGIGAILAVPSLALTVLHNACTALLVATLAVAAVTAGRAHSPP